MLFLRNNSLHTSPVMNGKHSLLADRLGLLLFLSGDSSELEVEEDSGFWVLCEVKAASTDRVDCVKIIVFIPKPAFFFCIQWFPGLLWTCILTWHNATPALLRCCSLWFSSNVFLEIFISLTDLVVEDSICNLPDGHNCSWCTRTYVFFRLFVLNEELQPLAAFLILSLDLDCHICGNKFCCFTALLTDLFITRWLRIDRQRYQERNGLRRQHFLPG